MHVEVERRGPRTPQETADFSRIYEDSFPVRERDDTSSVLQHIAQGERVCYLGIRDATVVALVVALEMADLSIGFLEYLAVDEAYRSAGVGTDMIEGMRAAPPGASARIEGMLLEVERPLEHPSAADPEPFRTRRISFYERNGAVVVDEARAYRAPESVGSGTLAYWLMWLPLLAGSPPPPSGRRLLDCVREIYHRSYGMAPDDPRVSELLGELGGRP